MMKIFAALLIVVACVHANSIHRYGWAPGTESVFRFESQILNGIPDIRATRFAGLKLMAEVRVQAFADYTLRIKMDKVRLATVNGDLAMTEARRIIATGGQDAEAQEQLPEAFRQALEAPVLVHLKRGLVEDFFVAKDEPIAVTNIKRSLLSQLQLDVSGAQRVSGSQKVEVGQTQGGYHKVIEESVLGKCHTIYSILPLTQARVVELEAAWTVEETQAKLAPSVAGKIACDGKPYYEIIKTRDLDNCHFNPTFQHVVNADLNGDASKSNVGNIQTRMVSSTTYACGDLSAFNIRKVVVDDTIVNNPVGINTEQRQRTTARILMELIKNAPATQKIAIPAQTRKETSLVYAYPEQEALRAQMSSDVVQKTMEILGTVPVLPQPTLRDAPKTLVPITTLPRAQIIAQVVAQMKTIAKEMYETPNGCTANHDVAGKLLTASKVMGLLSFAELEQVWQQTLAGATGEAMKTTKHVLIDTIAMVGTNPAALMALKKIDAAEICFIKAATTIQSAMKNIQTPTKELLREFVKTVRAWKAEPRNSGKFTLITPTLFQLSNLFYRAYVNPSTMVSNYPVRIYGVFGTKNCPVLTGEYIPLLREMLEESERDVAYAKEMKPALIAAMGKLGHLDAAKPLLKAAQGLNGEEPMLRALAIYSMKRIAKQNPTQIKPLLLAIANNPVDHADVRVAAIAVLPWTQPSYAELQKIAIRSWYETSHQVASFARSTVESLIATEIPELKAVGVKAKAVLHMFRPVAYGLQFSKNIHASQWVRYLLSSVSTKVAFTASQEEYTPTRVAFNNEILMDVLGAGFNMNLNAFALYGQGMENAIEYLLTFREIAGELKEVNPDVINELKKIANELKLIARPVPQFKSFLMARHMGFEHAQQFTQATASFLAGIAQEQGLVQKIRTGVAGAFVSAHNLFSATIVRPTVVGLPIIDRQDLPSVLAGNAYLKVDDTQYTVNAKLIPVWNVKYQSDFGIICPLTEQHLGNGVTAAMHVSVPVEAAIALKQGEMEITIKTPQETLKQANRVEALHAFIMPYTVRSSLKSIEPLNKQPNTKQILSHAQHNLLNKASKSFTGLFNGEFRYESDNEFTDLYSYWEKIRQNSFSSFLTAAPIMSSVRTSSVKFVLNPAMAELKEVTLRIKLWTQNPSLIMQKISKQVDATIQTEAKKATAAKKALEAIPQDAPAAIVKVEAELKTASAPQKYETYAVIGYKAKSHAVKTLAAIAVPATQLGNEAYQIFFSGDLKRPKIAARWNKEQLLQQPLELIYNAEIAYGAANADIEQQQRKIVVNAVLSKTQEQIKAVRDSEEFKKCDMEANAGRRLSPICIKVRHQAGSVDKVEATLKFPQEIYALRFWPTIEQFIKANLLAHYRQVVPAPQLAAGQLTLEATFARAGDVAQVKVAHHADAWQLENLRVPRQVQGIFPLCARNPIGDWLEQKATNNYAPASCRIEPAAITTFDNVSYAYKVNNCEHVVMMDGAITEHSRRIPVGVLTKTVAGEQKMVKVLAGKTKVEVIPASGAFKVLVNGREQAIPAGDTFIQKTHETGAVHVEIRHYQDGVFHIYAPNQMLHVVTDGKSIEVVAPQILKGRAVGLCGDLNGEIVADLRSPRNCIMKPKLAAMSYMLQNAQCAGIPQADAQAFKQQTQECIKPRTIATPVMSLFGEAQKSSFPLVSAHKVEKKHGKVCISKEKLKTKCGGESGSSSNSMMQGGELGAQEKMVKYACVASPSLKARSLKKRAMKGESLGIELASMGTEYAKMESEPMPCGAYGSSGRMEGEKGVESGMESNISGSGVYSESKYSSRGYESEMPGMGGVSGAGSGSGKGSASIKW